MLLFGFGPVNLTKFGLFYITKLDNTTAMTVLHYQHVLSAPAHNEKLPWKSFKNF